MAGWLRAAPRGAWRRACWAPLGTQGSCLEGLQPSKALLCALQYWERWQAVHLHGVSAELLPSANICQDMAGE